MATKKLPTDLVVVARGVMSPKARAYGRRPARRARTYEELEAANVSPLRAGFARLFVGKQVDDVVTEAVKEAYAAGAAAALEGVRTWAREKGIELDGDRVDTEAVYVKKLELELDAIFARLADWKIPRV